MSACKQNFSMIYQSVVIILFVFYLLIMGDILGISFALELCTTIGITNLKEMKVLST